MRLIGYWIESLHEQKWPIPQELVGPLPEHVRVGLANYLDGGETFAAYRGYSWCRFLCGRQMGSRELSDGHWVWPEDLGHYVRDHGVIVPDEFLQHALHGEPLPLAGCPAERPDAEFWIAWSRRTASGALRAKLERAREQFDAANERRLLLTIERVEREQGASAERCQWAGCHNYALAGLAMCASCAVRRHGRTVKLDAADEPRVFTLADVLGPALA